MDLGIWIYEPALPAHKFHFSRAQKQFGSFFFLNCARIMSSGLVPTHYESCVPINYVSKLWIHKKGILAVVSIWTRWEIITKKERGKGRSLTLIKLSLTGSRLYKPDDKYTRWNKKTCATQKDLSYNRPPRRVFSWYIFRYICNLVMGSEICFQLQSWDKILPCSVFSSQHMLV